MLLHDRWPSDDQKVYSLDGNSLWQVVQLISTSLIVCGSAGTLTDFLVSLAFFPLGLETVQPQFLGHSTVSTVSLTPTFLGDYLPILWYCFL